MTKEFVHSYWICETEDGRFNAISTATPRFCFSADTIDAVKAKVDRALSQYFGNEFKPVHAKRESSKSVSRAHVVRLEKFDSSQFAEAC